MNFFNTYKDLIICDYKFVFYSIKKNNFNYFFCLLFLIPFVFICLLLYIFMVVFFVFYYYGYFFKNLLYFKYSKFYYNVLFYKYPDKNYKNNFLILFLIFKNMAEKNSYKIMYSSQKFFYKKEEKRFSFSLFVYLIINFLLRFIFLIIFYFNIKVFTISINFLDVFFRNYKKKNLKTYKQFFETVFINFFEIYNQSLDDFVKNSRIIFDKTILKKIIFNPSEQIKMIKSLLNSKFKLNDDNLNLIKKYLDILKNNGDLEYSTLKEEVDKNYPECFTTNNKNYFVGEDIFHVSLNLPINQDKSLLIRETKSQFVNIKEINQNEIVNSKMITGFQGKGSINKNIIVNKTNIIEANLNNIYQQNNNKLLNNILKGLTNKNDFVGQFMSSMYKPVYVFEKGNIYKDPKYLNFHDKILNDSSLSLNRSESLETLKNLAKVWDEHFYLFKDVDNSEILDKIISFCLVNTDYVFSPEILQKIYDL